jgi:hypothetical protein
MVAKNEFPLGDQQLIHHYIYLLDIFDHLLPELSQKLLLRRNLIYSLIKKKMKHQSNIQDISAKNMMLDYV